MHRDCWQRWPLPQPARLPLLCCYRCCQLNMHEVIIMASPTGGAFTGKLHSWNTPKVCAPWQLASCLGPQGVLAPLACPPAALVSVVGSPGKCPSFCPPPLKRLASP